MYNYTLARPITRVFSFSAVPFRTTMPLKDAYYYYTYFHTYWIIVNHYNTHHYHRNIVASIIAYRIMVYFLIITKTFVNDILIFLGRTNTTDTRIYLITSKCISYYIDTLNNISTIQGVYKSFYLFRSKYARTITKRVSNCEKYNCNEYYN